MITVEKRDACLEYLADTDAQFAKAKAYMVGIEDQKSTILSQQFLHSAHKTVDAKKAESNTSIEYLKWRDAHQEAFYGYELLRNQRSTAALFVDVWRSELSALKQGIVI